MLQTILLDTTTPVVRGVTWTKRTGAPGSVNPNAPASYNIVNLGARLPGHHESAAGQRGD